MSAAPNPQPPPGGRAWRYPPIIALVVGIVLAAVVLPSALNLPQANPTEIAEYAPVPPTQQNPPAVGNLGALGLGSSGTLEGLPQGNGNPGDATVDNSVPAELDCVIVDGSPHQTADPLSPPCVPSFVGDNYGSTYEGVTGSEIRVIVYLDGGNGGNSAQTGDYCGFYSGETNGAKPNSMYYDLDLPPGKSASNPAFPESNSSWVPEIRDLDKYFNTHYQMYHRHVHMRVYMSGPPSTAGANCLSAQDRVRDASEEIQSFHPFAVINDSASFQDAYANYMAQHGVLNFLAMNRLSDVPHVGFPEKFFQSYPGLIWSYVPAIEQNAQWEADWMCKEIVQPGKVTFSGNGDTGHPRTYGLVRPRDPNAPTYGLFADALTKDLNNCGVNFLAEEDIPTAGFDIDQTGAVDANNPTQTDPNASTYAQKAMLNFKEKGVTTVIWASGTDNYTTQAASSYSYFPEWVLAGDGRLESTTDALVQDPAEWQHVFVVSRIARLPDAYHQECFLAYADTDPNAQTPSSFPGGVACAYYEDFRLLWTGVQVAGPRLTPQSMDEGYHAIPKVSLNTPYVPTCYFNPGDYTCIKDYEISWYDASGTTPDGGNGCWRMIHDGQRYLEGDYPSGDVSRYQGRGTDACNDYA